MNIEPVQRVLDGLGASYALIGAHAMAVRGYPRFTVDIDLLTSDERVLGESTWCGLRRAGAAAVDPRRGDAEDPLGGVVHILLADGTDVDVVVSKWSWEAKVIERAEPVALAGHRHSRTASGRPHPAEAGGGWLHGPARRRGAAGHR